MSSRKIQTGVNLNFVKSMYYESNRTTHAFPYKSHKMISFSPTLYKHFFSVMKKIKIVVFDTQKILE